MLLIQNPTNDWTKSRLFLPVLYRKTAKLFVRKLLSETPTFTTSLCCMKRAHYSERMLHKQDCVNPKRAGLFGPISQPGSRFHPPKISETNWQNIKCVVLVDSYDPPESIGTKKSTNIPCMTPQWRYVKNTKITKNRQNHGFSLFCQAKLHFLAMMCVKVCLHMFLLQINQINKIKHSESVSWKQKTRFVCNFHWKSVFGQFFVGPSALLRNAAS